jgi:hypothetical protein
MRNFFGLVLLVLSVLGTANYSKASEPIEFTLINQTSTTMTAMYITLPYDRKWNRNIIGKGSYVRPGEELDVSINDRKPDCVYDVLMTFKNGKILEGLEVDLCEMDRDAFDIYNEDLMHADSGTDLYDVLKFLFD